MQKGKLKSKEDIEKISYSCRVLGGILYRLRDMIVTGISLIDIDNYVEKEILQAGGVPSFKGFHGFPNASCISVNEDVIHGIPTKYKLCEGDIVGVDIGMNYKGGYGDTAYTYAVGEISEEKSDILGVTEASLYKGIEKALDGNRVGDISSAIETYVRRYKYSLVREYCGHGVGHAVWEEPSIPNIGRAGYGERLRGGMVVAIEPMVNLGGPEIFIQKDGWTVTTKDRKSSAHFEHTIWIKDDGTNEVLTAQNDDK